MKHWEKIGQCQSFVFRYLLILTVSFGVVRLSSAGVEIFKDLAFGSDDQKLDLYLPKNSDEALKGTQKSSSKLEVPKSHALLVFFHGGAWQSGDKSNYRSLGLGFAEQGLAVVVPNYRLAQTGEAPTFPQFEKESAEALAWTLTNAKSYDFDRQRTFLMGHSAGAEISSLLALDPQYLRDESAPSDFRIAGLILIEGIYDLQALVRTRPEYKSAFVQKAFGDSLQNWNEASPQSKARIKSASSWFVVHSLLDEDVPPSQSQNFVNQLRATGCHAELVNSISLGHFEMISKLGDPKDSLTQKIVAFVRATKPAPID